MSNNSSPGEGVALVDPPEVPAPPARRPPTPAGEDGATTPGGPTMVLLGLTAFITYKVWRHRRRRAGRG